LCNRGIYIRKISPQNIIQVIISRIMRWAANLAHVGDKRDASRLLQGDMGERDPLEDFGMDGRTI
jgi:hypothetical protein